jgi:hypothetical protein
VDQSLHALRYDQLNEALPQAVAQLWDAYASERDWWGENWEQAGPHAVYGAVLNPYLIDWLESPGHDALLQRIFAFLEALATHPDPKVGEVVGATVIECLTDEKAWIQTARAYMGPACLQISHDMEAAWVDLKARYGDSPPEHTP